MQYPDNPDFALSGYEYTLPEDCIAQHPAAERSMSRLLCLSKADTGMQHANFADIARFLPERALLVANNSRVIPARVFGQRPGSGRVEMLLLTPLPLVRVENGTDGMLHAKVEVLLRPAKKIRPGDVIRFDNDFSLELLKKEDFGRCQVRLNWRGDLLGAFTRTGEMPLPPYIRRPDRVDYKNDALNRDARAICDIERYQTTYARADKAGSVAAPTAGLHFTDALRRELADQGHEWAEVTLYVGYGTFSPVRSPDIRDHVMHSEYVEVPEKTALAVCRAKKEGRPIIAVGTTSARTLEGAFAARSKNAAGSNPKELHPFAGWTDIFLYPGKNFNIIDGLVTNFHLPQSSLLMLVSALAGRERILRAYAEALARGYRFFSYGDAMLIV